MKALRYFFFAYPALWVLGLDNFAWVALLIIAAFGRKRARAPVGYQVGLVFFVLSALLAATQIEEYSRFLTWAWDFGLIVLSLVLIRRTSELELGCVQKQLFVPASVVIVFSVLLGCFSLVIGKPLEMITPMYYALPDTIAGTDFAKALVVKRMHSQAWFAGFTYLRLKSTFSYATSYAAALSVFVIAYAMWRKRLPRWFSIVAVGALVCLTFTTSRTSIAALLLGTGLLTFFRYKIPTLAWGGIIIFAGSIIFATGLLDAGTTVEKVSSLRGGGSKTTRLEIYSQTIKGIIANPLGHGSQKDVPEIEYPLGSHSTWLGLAFKFGVVGLVSVLTAFFGLAWNRIEKGNTKAEYVVPVFAMVLIISLLEELYLDSTTAILLSVVIGGILANHGNRDRQAVAP